MIYYCYNKATGFYAGSGTPQINTPTHGSTTVANRTDYNKWTGTEWVTVDAMPTTEQLPQAEAEASL
jgi:hypothetical protein